MDIVFKYCGGCNCQIDRSKVIQDIKALLPAGFRLNAGATLPFDAGILVCGCPSACAWKPELANLAKHWIVIAGKTVDSQDLAEEKLAMAAVEKIKTFNDL